MRIVSCAVILTVLELALTRGDGDTSRTRRSSVNDHYVDDHCEGHFQVESNTIIRTEDSINMGGSFLNETQVLSLSRCLHYCCQYPLCNTAVFDERMDTTEGGSCYLFDCGSLENLKCQFTANPDFSSAVLDIDRHKFDIDAQDHRQGHSNQLELLRSREGEDSGAESRACGDYQFRCRSGECVATYDTCNGIPQCTDASDEDPGMCSTSTTLSPPSNHIHMRPDMDPPQQQQYPYRQQQQQLPAQGTFWPQQQQQMTGFPDSRKTSYGGAGSELQRRFVRDLKESYESIMKNFRFNSEAGPGSISDYFYPGDGNTNNVMNSQRGSLGPDFVYQYPNRQGFQFPGQYQPNQGYPPQPQYPYQGYPQQPLLPQQQPQPVNQPQITPQPTNPVTKTTKSTTTKGTTRKIVPETTTTTTMSPEEIFEADLISKLGDELTSMEFPGYAIFTLTMGILLTCFLCVVIVCRIKQGKMGFRRGLAHDADGDFLVNGMYL